jgi:hypothetical protein
MLNITIHTANQSDEFLDLILDLQKQGYTVVVNPPLPPKPQPLSHEQVDVINTIMK